MLTLEKKVKHLLFLFFIILLVSSVKAEKKQLAIHGGYTFETREGQKNIAVYLSFFNVSSEKIKIKEFSSEIAEKIELHEIKLVNDIVKMTTVDELTIEPKSEMFLQPGGTHLMFFNIKKPLRDNDSFELTIELKNKKILRTEIMVLNKELRKNLLN